MAIAIQADCLSKRYTLGTQQVRAGSFRAAVTGLPRRMLKRAPGAGTEFWALRDVSFSVQEGEVIGIMGRNGAGKSTLLKVLSRITKPTSGRGVMHGRVGSLLEVGTGFHPELTGRENVFLNGSILGMPRHEIAAKFDAIVDFAGVEQFIDTAVKFYSSGMYMRLAFAVAAHLDPEILIVDEVLAVGDAAFQKKCLGKMNEVSRQGRTVCFVSHNMGTVSALCHTALWLEKGRVHAYGPARELVSQYMTDNAGAAAANVDLTNLPRIAPYFGTQLKLTALEWLRGYPLKHGDTARCRVTCIANEDCEDLSLGVGFASLEGTRLLAYFSDEADASTPRRRVARGTQVQVDFTLPELPLAPGTYQFFVDSRSGDMHALDYLPEAAIVDISPGERTPAHIIRPGAGVRMPPGIAWQDSAA
jgi:lipopolysaccharide transport system ATP-binding protein